MATIKTSDVGRILALYTDETTASATASRVDVDSNGSITTPEVKAWNARTDLLRSAKKKRLDPVLTSTFEALDAPRAAPTVKLPGAELPPVYWMDVEYQMPDLVAAVKRWTRAVEDTLSQVAGRRPRIESEVLDWKRKLEQAKADEARYLALIETLSSDGEKQTITTRDLLKTFKYLNSTNGEQQVARSLYTKLFCTPAVRIAERTDEVGAPGSALSASVTSRIGSGGSEEEVVWWAGPSTATIHAPPGRPVAVFLANDPTGASQLLRSGQDQTVAFGAPLSGGEKGMTVLLLPPIPAAGATPTGDSEALKLSGEHMSGTVKASQLP